MASVDAATTQEGDIIFQMVKAYFENKTLPQHVYSPVKLLTAENIDMATPWDAESYLAKKASGHITRDYTKLKVVDTPRTWSKTMNNYQNLYFHR